jgi:nucleoside-diphosphate-sugar epimerase
MQGRVVVLGGSGLIGREIVSALRRKGWSEIVTASRHPLAAPGITAISCDVRERAAVARAVAGAAYVVNAAGGSIATMMGAVNNLISLNELRGVSHIVHISSLAVFGQTSGTLDEATTPRPFRWHRYALAKLQGERLLLSNNEVSAKCTILRPGCVYGVHGGQWVDGVGHLLLQGRLGQMGAGGGGVAQLIHAADVAWAVEQALSGGRSMTGICNLTPANNLTWNQYFVLLAARIGCSDLRQIGTLSATIETWFAGPPRLAFGMLTGRHAGAVTPAMRRLFAGQARVVSTHPIGLCARRFVSVQDGISEAADRFSRRRAANKARDVGDPGVAARGRARA